MSRRHVPVGATLLPITRVRSFALVLAEQNCRWDVKPSISVGQIIRKGVHAVSVFSGGDSFGGQMRSTNVAVTCDSGISRTTTVTAGRKAIHKATDSDFGRI